MFKPQQACIYDFLRTEEAKIGAYALSAWTFNANELGSDAQLCNHIQISCFVCIRTITILVADLERLTNELFLIFNTLLVVLTNK